MKKEFLSFPLELCEQAIALFMKNGVYFKAEPHTENNLAQVSILYEESESLKIEMLKLDLCKMILLLPLVALIASNLKEPDITPVRPWKYRKSFNK